jgi:hypothetical protein
MFRANLTISKIAREKRPAFGRAFSFVQLNFLQHPRTKSPGVTEEFWQMPSVRRYAAGFL